MQKTFVLRAFLSLFFSPFRFYRFVELIGTCMYVCIYLGGSTLVEKVFISARRIKSVGQDFSTAAYRFKKERIARFRRSDFILFRISNMISKIDR